MNGMEILLDIDSNLNDNQPLYRIVDFFAATDVISTQKLRFSRADTFQDQNEGIDRLLRQIQYGTRLRCGGMGWTDIESAKREHSHAQKSHFIVCWITNPESVAMWSLYSPDRTSVRMKTSVGKLRKTLLNALSEKSLMRLSEADLGKHVVVCVGARISNVVYESLQDLLYSVTRRAKAQDRLFDQYTRRNKEIPIIVRNASRFYARQAFGAGSVMVLRELRRMPFASLQNAPKHVVQAWHAANKKVNIEGETEQCACNPPVKSCHA